MIDKFDKVMHQDHSTMSDEEFALGAAKLLEEEDSQPLAWWYLSFCDTHRPEGQQFLGACIVKATGFLGATIVARTLGCNPGGECAGVGPVPLDQEFPDQFVGRLLTRAEINEFDRLMGCADD